MTRRPVAWAPRAAPDVCTGPPRAAPDVCTGAEAPAPGSGPEPRTARRPSGCVSDRHGCVEDVFNRERRRPARRAAPKPGFFLLSALTGAGLRGEGRTVSPNLQELTPLLGHMGKQGIMILCHEGGMSSPRAGGGVVRGDCPEEGAHEEGTWAGPLDGL